MDSADTQARLDKLSTDADALTHAVQALNTTADRITRRTRRSETVIAFLVISFILDITVTAFVFVGLNRLDTTTREVQATQANGQIVRQEVLCPLYQLFLSSYSTKARDTNPKGPVFYDNAFATLRK